jgi:hypothetical protein
MSRLLAVRTVALRGPVKRDNKRSYTIAVRSFLMAFAST